MSNHTPDGPDRYVGERPTGPLMGDDIAPCRKCNTSIDADARRCPSCGYEPGTSTLGRILYLLAFPWAVLFGGLAVGTILLVPAAGLAVGDAVGALVATAILGGPSWWYVRRHRQRRRQGAAER